jgi:hypothetical protein
MVHGCTLFLPLQTRTTGLWTNNEQPKRRNEMSDKMITPEEYLIENPTHMIYKDDDRSESYYGIIKSCLCFYTVNKNINWTGYTEPHVMIGPEFPQSRKREVKWGKWRITQDKVNKGDVPFQRVELPDGGTCFRIGQYIDEPSQELNSEPYQNPIAGKGSELSRFLPDGWEWKQAAREGNWLTGPARYSFFTCKELWHGHGLLHPSEGGGFQKHTPGDPMPCDGRGEEHGEHQCQSAPSTGYETGR